MGKYGFHVLDADGHGGEFANWQDGIPDALKPRLAEYRDKIKKHYSRLPLPGGGQARPGDKFDIRPGMNDPKLRLEDMDLEGIDVTVTFPGGAGEEWAMLDPEFSLALCQAVNNSKAAFNDVAVSQEYTDRIEAINFSLAHDDGQSAKNLAAADVILVGVSRSGKTPTSIYLAMQHGIKAANYPLIPEDFERRELPATLAPHKAKCFGLTIDPARLAQIRNERRPNSRYASLENCRHEVAEAEAMMRRSGIAWLSSTHKSIEEIATTILRDLRPDRLMY